MTLRFMSLNSDVWVFLLAFILYLKISNLFLKNNCIALNMSLKQLSHYSPTKEEISLHPRMLIFQSVTPRLACSEIFYALLP